MTDAPPATLGERVPSTDDPDAIIDAFMGWVDDRGLSLYPAQEEALLEIVAGSHVIVNTPTGSGKSLVATAAHFTARTPPVRRRSTRSGIRCTHSSNPTFRCRAPSSTGAS